MAHQIVIPAKAGTQLTGLSGQITLPGSPLSRRTVRGKRRSDTGSAGIIPSYCHGPRRRATQVTHGRRQELANIFDTGAKFQLGAPVAGHDKFGERYGSRSLRYDLNYRFRCTESRSPENRDYRRQKNL
jgi:hypothetical protein